MYQSMLPLFLEHTTAFITAIFLGPWAFLGIGLLAKESPYFYSLFLAALIGDAYVNSLMYTLGFLGKPAIRKGLLFLKIKEAHVDTFLAKFTLKESLVHKAKKYLQGKALFPLFLIVPLLSHSIDGVTYFVCGMLRVPFWKFFITNVSANLLLGIIMTFFAETIFTVLTPILHHTLFIYSVITLCLTILFLILHFGKKKKLAL